jgi:hypothetical protein
VVEFETESEKIVRREVLLACDGKVFRTGDLREVERTSDNSCSPSSLVLLLVSKESLAMMVSRVETARGREDNNDDKDREADW